MDVASIASQANALEGNTKKDAIENPKSILNKDDFLKLLVAQLKNQDPLNPLDNDQFIQENTMFSQLEQLTNMNKSIEGVSGNLGKNDRSYAASYLGKYITTGSENINVSKSNIDTLSFSLPTDAAVKVSILNSKGENITDIDLGNMSKGNHTFQWDGKDSKGNYVADGTYSVIFSAVDANGQTIPIEKNAGKVVAVRFDSSGVVLSTNLNNNVKLNDVKSVFDGGL